MGVSALTLAAGSYFLTGGAGFIGSHFVDRLLGDRATRRVTVYDNFSSGRAWHLEPLENDGRLRVVEGDVKDLSMVTSAIKDHDVVIHLASNPDIARAAVEPTIDFDEGTYLTSNVVEAMRRSTVRRILYASGSGIYGDLGETDAHEDWGPLMPISTYGASKLAGEALIAAYCFMFNLTGCVFRFGNVVGPRQTHGVGFDFVRHLHADPTRLRILGDGSQSKSYIHVDDVVTAVLLANQRSRARFEAYNVATGDYVTVREIADLAVESMQLDSDKVEYEFTGGDRGWKGDVPVVRLATERIRSLGWTHTRSSREALLESMAVLAIEARAGRV